MRKIASQLLLVAIMLVAAAGCSKKSNNDSESLLSTIPADASSVVMIDLEQTLTSLGCKTDGNTITLSDEMRKKIDESKGLSERNKRIFNDVCKGETGISITSVAFFSAARSYVTGLLNDPDKFVAYAAGMRKNPNDSTSTAAEVTEENGARVIGRNTVVIGNQFWLCTEGSADTEQLKYYQNLNDKQSYASSETAGLLLSKGKVVTYVADVKRSFNRMPESQQMRMAASLMFDDISYIAGSASIEKKSLLSVSHVLNSKMEPAKLLLPTEKIDPAVVKSLDMSGDLFIAAGLSKKLTEKIADALAGVLGANAGPIATPLRQIDGTAAACISQKSNAMTARIETTGKDFASLSNLLQMLPGVSVTRDGDVLTVTPGNAVPEGTLNSTEAADRLKGAWIGLVASDMPSKGMNTTALLMPEGKSLTLKIEIEGGTEALLEVLL